MKDNIDELAMNSKNKNIRDLCRGINDATSRKVTGSNPNEVTGFFSIDLILPDALGPGVYSASNRNEYQELIKNNFPGEWSAASA
jgi:hypothetical protein